MNITMSRAQYDALPDRQTYDGVPRDGDRFRDSLYKTALHCCASRDHGHWPNWWTFTVDIRE